MSLYCIAYETRLIASTEGANEDENKEGGAQIESVEEEKQGKAA